MSQLYWNFWLIYYLNKTGYFKLNYLKGCKNSLGLLRTTILKVLHSWYLLKFQRFDLDLILIIGSFVKSCIPLKCNFAENSIVTPRWIISLKELFQWQWERKSNSNFRNRFSSLISLWVLGWGALILWSEQPVCERALSCYSPL